MSNNAIYGFASTPSGTAPTGAIASNATAGIAYVGQGGLWVPLLTTTAGGTVTLAGDVSGVSSGNVVEKLTGLAGIVTLVGTTIKPATVVGTGSGAVFAAGDSSGDVGGLLKLYGGGGVTPGSVDIKSSSTSGGLFIDSTRLLASVAELRSTVSFTVKPEDATGTGLGLLVAAGDGTVTGGLLKLYGGGGPASGSVAIQASSSEGGVNVTAASVTVTLPLLQFGSSVSAPVIGQATIAGTPSALTVQAQSSSTTKGGNLSLVTGAGAGGSHGDMLFTTGGRPVVTFFDASNPIVHVYSPTFRFDESTSSPVISHQGRTGDIACTDLRIKSQAPFASAASNKLPGNLIYEVPAPAAGGDPPGYHSFLVSDVEYVNITTAQVTLNTAVVFTRSFLAGGSRTIYCDIAGAGLNGNNFNFEGQQGGAGTTNGGDVHISGGPASGAGIPGGVVLELGGVAMVQLSQFNSQNVLGLLAGGVSAANVPADTAASCIFVGDCSVASIGAGFPVGGFVMYSDDGRPGFKTAFGAGAVGERMFTFDGEMTVAGGALDRYFVVYIDGTRYKFPVHLDS